MIFIFISLIFLPCFVASSSPEKRLNNVDSLFLGDFNLKRGFIDQQFERIEVSRLQFVDIG